MRQLSALLSSAGNSFNKLGTTLQVVGIAS